jgi:hypothetical protein
VAGILWAVLGAAVALGGAAMVARSARRKTPR